jgi:hypothetical protein
MILAKSRQLLPNHQRNHAVRILGLLACDRLTFSYCLGNSSELASLVWKD